MEESITIRIRPHGGQAFVNTVEQIAIDVSHNAKALSRIDEARLKGLQHLDLKGLGLTTIPDEIRELTQLKSLDLSINCDLSETSNLHSLVELTTLNLSNTAISCISKEICSLRELRNLNVSDNKLSTFTDEFSQLSNLEILKLQRNHFQAIPSCVFALSDLKELDLMSNQISIIPPNIAELGKLQKLNLGFNKLSQVPSQISELMALTSLSFAESNLMQFPAALLKLKSLEHLRLDRNLLTEIPDEIIQFLELKELLLSENQLESLPSKLFTLPRLSTFYIGDNRLRIFKFDVPAHSILKILDIRGNGLRIDESTIFDFTNLESLSLRRNRLDSLPRSIRCLSKLRSLDLAKNRLTTLPDEVFSLNDLNFLDLNSNELTALSSKIGECRQLTYLDLSSNPMKEVPNEIECLPKLKTFLADGIEIRLPAASKTQFGFNWISNRATIAKGEISILALIETILSVALLSVLSLWFDSLKWFAVASFVAPLLLLKTPESVKKGIQWIKNFTVWPLLFLTSFILFIGISFWLVGIKFILIALIFPGVLLAGTAGAVFLSIRFVAVLISVVRHPRSCLAAIPGNWMRIVLATDFATPPEFLPGWHRKVDFNPFPKAFHGLRGMHEWGPADFFGQDYIGQFFRGSIYRRWACISAGILLYAMSAAHRLAVKATSLIYLPLIWIARKGTMRPPNLHFFFIDYLKDDWRRLQLYVSVALLLALMGKIAFMFYMQNFIEFWNSNAMARFFKILVVPHEIPLWQAATGCNCLITISMWFYAKKTKRLLDTGRGPSPSTTISLLQIVAFISSMLVVYTIACTLIIIGKNGDILHTLRRLLGFFGHDFFP